MRTNCLFTLLLMVLVSAGCNTLDRQSPPDITTVPPYMQSQSQHQEQFAQMRSFHEKESAKMSEDVHHFRNREIERLEAASKEFEKDKLWQEDYEKTLERREKWMSWFKKK